MRGARRAAAGASTRRQFDRPAQSSYPLALLVGLRPAKGDCEPLIRERQVVRREPYEFRASKGAREAHQEQGAVPLAQKTRWETLKHEPEMVRLVQWATSFSRLFLLRTGPVA